MKRRRSSNKNYSPRKVQAASSRRTRPGDDAAELKHRLLLTWHLLRQESGRTTNYNRQLQIYRQMKNIEKSLQNLG